MQFSYLSQHNQVNYLECDKQSYCSLMETYENNYRLIKKIMDSQAEFFIKNSKGISYFIQTVKQSKYTTHLCLTISQTGYNNNTDNLLQTGKMTIRVYHDARVAEADFSGKNRKPSNNLKYLWQRNTLLNHWLVSMNKLKHAQVKRAGKPSANQSYPDSA